MSKKNSIRFSDRSGFEVELPFEAIEQLYGELGLSPGTGAMRFGGCACAVGIVREAQEKGVIDMALVPEITGLAFDDAGRGDNKNLGLRARYDSTVERSRGLGSYFRQRLGERLPDAWELF